MRAPRRPRLRQRSPRRQDPLPASSIALQPGRRVALGPTPGKTPQALIRVRGPAAASRTDVPWGRRPSAPRRRPLVCAASPLTRTGSTWKAWSRPDPEASPGSPPPADPANGRTRLPMSAHPVPVGVDRGPCRRRRLGLWLGLAGLALPWRASALRSLPPAPGLPDTWGARFDAGPGSWTASGPEAAEASLPPGPSPSPGTSAETAPPRTPAPPFEGFLVEDPDGTLRFVPEVPTEAPVPDPGPAPSGPRPRSGPWLRLPPAPGSASSGNR